jgi:hypothetical protein
VGTQHQIDIWLTEPGDGFPVQYAASFSPAMRAFCNATDFGKRSIPKIREQVEQLVLYFEENGEALGLKMPTNDGLLMRQVDLRTAPNGPILFKTWTGWEESKQWWRVHLEGPNETFWEDQIGNPELN